jgi:outer membrane lipoprotein carrier protein
MKIKWLMAVWFIYITLPLPLVFCQDSGTSSGSLATLPVAEIIKKVEARYDVLGFSADFFQESTLKAMDITDTAQGRITIKRPGKMRWEYDQPEKQIIVSDGIQLWIYRPEDQQVMVGGAPDFFGDGKGASFLSDIKLMRKNFQIIMAETDDGDGHTVLELEPISEDANIARIFISIVPETFDIVEVITYNPYGDETRIKLKNINFRETIDDAIFRFEVPPGVEIMQLAQ